MSKNITGEIVHLKKVNEQIFCKKYYNFLPIKEVNQNDTLDKVSRSVGGLNTFDDCWSQSTSRLIFNEVKIDHEKVIELSNQSDPIENIYYGNNDEPFWLLKDDNVIDEEILKKRFGDLTTTIRIERKTLVVSEIDDKLKITIYQFKKTRLAGTKYYKRQQHNQSITINKKTGNVYLITRVFNNRKWSSIIHRNPFAKLFETMVLHQLSNFGWDKTEVIQIIDEINEIIRVRLNVDKVFYYSSIYKDPPGVDSTKQVIDPKLSLTFSIFQWFLDEHKIKTPNAPLYLLIKYYPGLKKLRKHDMRLVSTIMSEYQFNSKKIKQLLHNKPNIDIQLLFLYFHLFGVDHFNKLTDNEIEIISHVQHVDPYANFIDLTKLYQMGVSRVFDVNGMVTTVNIKNNKIYNQIDLSLLSNKLNVYEKRCCVNYLKDIINKIPKTGKYGDTFNRIADHIIFRDKLLDNGVDIKMKFNSVETFDHEHNYWSKLIHHINSSYLTSFHYDKFFKDVISQSITIKSSDGGEKTYYPIVLSSCDMYFDEHLIQHHCVNTYITNYNSIIISLREGHPVSEERTTCEYRFDGHFISIQKQRRYNTEIKNDDWVQALAVLDKKLNDYNHRYTYVKPKIEIYNKVSKKTTWKVPNGESGSNYIDEQEPIAVGQIL